nr:hypothetical protein [Tanacetum cinerariifolium]
PVEIRTQPQPLAIVLSRLTGYATTWRASSDSAGLLASKKEKKRLRSA